MSKVNSSILVTAALAGLCSTGLSAVAADPPGSSEMDLGSSSCKEVMRMSGAERDLALAFVHGYMLGKKGTTRYDIEKLSAITDRFLDYCLDHPTENALRSFEKVAR